MQGLVHALHRLMPGSVRHVLDDAGHLLPLTHAAQIAELILGWLHADAERRLR
jgi:pimeloyl-ACP methyl ester carboxylesterase